MEERASFTAPLSFILGASLLLSRVIVAAVGLRLLVFFVSRALVVLFFEGLPRALLFEAFPFDFVTFLFDEATYYYLPAELL